MPRDIYLDAPSVGSLEKKYLNQAVDSGFVSSAGPLIEEFERSFAKFVSAKGAVATQSGTAAIHVALHELGIGRGDEVIVPALTFIATVNPIVYAGATPVFADVDQRTWTIDPKEIEARITKKTKAIIPVHLYGNPCDMPAIMRLAKRHGLYVIEDATESLGATFNKRPTGTWGELGCFSFNGNKMITTGGGGMVVSENSARLEHIKFLVNQARDTALGYYHPEIGFNYRMTNIEAAMGLAQLTRIEEFQRKKENFKRIYHKELDTEVLFQKEYDGARSSAWLTCICFKKPVNIGLVQSQLREQGIQSRRLFMPVSDFPPYQKCKRGKLTHSRDIYERGLCLPSSMLNSEKDIRTVCAALKKVLHG